MHYSTSTLLALAGMASAQTLHVVSVSGEGDWALKFSPDNLKAAVGDMVQFQFRAGNHSVVQSNFDNPCSPIGQNANATGFYSGYQLVEASEAMGMIPTYTVMIADEKPIWAYCSQGKHCQAGMVMVINEDTTANETRSLDNYKQAAAAVPASSAGGDTGAGDAGTATPAPEDGADDAEDGSTDGTTGGDSSTGDDSTTGGDDASTGTPAEDNTGTGTQEGAQASASAIQQAGASTFAVTSTMGLVALAAAFFTL